MPIDFSQVKAVTIPEGSVIEITDSTGNLLWEGVGWHTIWKGSKTCSVNTNGTDTPVLEGAEDSFAQTKSGTGYTPKIRITYEYSRGNTNYTFKYAYIINDNWHYGDDFSPNNPITIEAVSDSSDSVILFAPACKRNSIPELYGYAGIRKRRDTENNRIIFDMYPYVSSNITSYDPNFLVTLKITKIEQYY